MNKEDIDFLISIQDLEQPEFDNACLERENKKLQQENKQLKEEIEEYKRIEQEDLKAFNNYDSILTELEEWLREYFSINNGASECPLSSQSEIKEMKIENKFILEVLRRISELKEKYK